jgi:hypothetical protein
MKIPVTVRDCTAFLGYWKDDRSLWMGATAFFVVMPMEFGRVCAHYVITAKHVIEKINELNKDIILQVNCKAGHLEYFKTSFSDWKTLPNSPDDDIAVLAVDPKLDLSVGGGLDHLFVSTESFLGTAKLPQSLAEIGSNIAVAGLFNRMVNTRKNYPIVRVGNIAGAPDEPIEISVDGRRFSFKAYLVEARSIGGLSGSPVFLQIDVASLSSLNVSVSGPLMHTDKGPTHQEPIVTPTTNMFVQHALLGMMFGHYDAKLTDHQSWTTESLNLGISIVVPASKIMEVLNLDCFKQEREKKVAEYIKITCSTVYDKGD